MIHQNVEEEIAEIRMLSESIKARPQHEQDKFRDGLHALDRAVHKEPSLRTPEESVAVAEYEKFLDSGK